MRCQARRVTGPAQRRRLKDDWGTADSCCSRVHACLCRRRALRCMRRLAWGWRAGQEQGFPDINIVMEKVAFDGITRFEDRERMPLGAPRPAGPPAVPLLAGPVPRMPVPSACTSAGRYLLSHCLTPGKACTWGWRSRF